MAGDKDPITPIVFSETIATNLPPELVQFARFGECGHGLMTDDQHAALQAIRDFILS
jgi:proline iminopeptidase